ncbi:MAG: hypothetical protein LQ338_002259 [Usnochroma carphineum]|nr:MAG: hypothetical protein LQ338_002259 [Usnochroma carphineum]
MTRNVPHSSLAFAANRAPWMNDLIRQIQTEVIARLDCIGIPAPHRKDAPSAQEQKVNKTLFPFVSEARGIDVSSAMVNAYNDGARAANLPETDMYAFKGDILTSSANGEHGDPFAKEEWFEFSIAVMSMALHHVASPADAIGKLVGRLKEGGTILVIDWLLSSVVFDDSGHPKYGHGDHQKHPKCDDARVTEHAHNMVPGSGDTITRAGFEKEEMEKMLRDAGCDSIGFVEFEKMTRLGDGDQAVMQRLFLARGTKG